jgi:hypothetical protein
MPALKVEQFGGQLPAWDQRLLPPGQAAASTNGYLFSGALKGWRQPKVLRALTNPAARMAFRLPTLSEAQAFAYLVFKAIPQNLDTVTIGDVIYRWRSQADIAITPMTIGDVFIGPAFPVDILVAAQNLLAAITADQGTNLNAGVLYGMNTVANQDVKWSRQGTSSSVGLLDPILGLVNIAGTNYTYLQVGSVDFGAAYNLVGVAESTANARATWLKDLLAFADTTVTYQGGSNAYFNNDITAPATWLEFNDQDTNVLKSQVVDDKYNRYYAASPSQPPSYNPYDRIKQGKPFWLLGVPPPGCAPNVAVAGGGNNFLLGGSVAGGGEYVGTSNSVYLLPITPTGATTITDIKFVPSVIQLLLIGDLLNANFQGVVYNDNNGVPGGLYDVTPNVATISGSNTSVATFTTPVNLLAGQKYWIGVAIDSVFHFAAQFGGITNMVGFTNSYTNGPPQNAPGPSNGLLQNLIGINMWADCVSADVVEARSYVYTWVSAYNEEGPPSPATLVNGWSNGVWTIGLWQPPPNDQGIKRNLTSINIYRTVVGSGGNATFFLVANVPITTGTYIDILANDVVSLKNQMPSTNWFPPPENLQGIIAMPNGIMAGFAENQVWFCEPFHPHAWPPGYVLTTEFPIVGLGLTSGALVVCTSTVPYVVQGNAPGAMVLTKCALANPCASRGSIVSGDAAVTYMSPNGLIQVTPQAVATNTTDLWFTREQWTALTPQKFARAIYLASCYFAYGSTSPATVIPADNSVAQQGFTIELDADSQSFTIWPQPGGHRLGYNTLQSHTGFNIDNVLTDGYTGIGLLISNGSIYWYDFTDANPVMVTYVWRSKIYQQNTKKNYEAAKVFFQVPPGTPALAPVRNELPPTDPSWATLGANQYLIVRTYADIEGDAAGNSTGNMVLVDCREVRSSGELLRLPSGFKCEMWQWEITGRVTVSNMQVATSAKDLSNV